MNESIEESGLPKTRWQKIDSYDLRLVVLLTALFGLGGDLSEVLWFGVSALAFLFGSRLGAPEWRFIDLDHETDETGFVAVVLHWVSVVGLWLAIGFYVWDPAEFKFVSALVGCLIYAVALVVSFGVHSFDTFEEQI